MPEAHQALAALELMAQQRLGALGRPDLEDHVQRGAGRTAVQRAFQSTQGAHHGGGQIRLG